MFLIGANNVGAYLPSGVSSRSLIHPMDEDARHDWYKKRKCRFTKKLRKTMTPTEIILWEILRDRRFKGLKFRRQVNIGPYIADFLCIQHRLIVEIDGSSHDDRKEYDQDRDTYLQEHGYYVLRVTNRDIFEDIDSFLQQIVNAIHSKRSSPSPVSQEKS